MLINASYFMRRIGENNEQPNDRRFCTQLMIWQWRHDWKKAEAEFNWSEMDYLDREWERINSL